MRHWPWSRSVPLAGVPRGRVRRGGVPDGGHRRPAGAISGGDLKEWLSYIASDELRAGTCSTGLGLAAGYIENHLRLWNAKPPVMPDRFYRRFEHSASSPPTRSTLTVEVSGQTRTFTDGDGVTFPRKSAPSDASRSIGSSLRPRPRRAARPPRGSRHEGRAGAAVVWLGDRGPRDVDTSLYRVLLASRDRYAIQQSRRPPPSDLGDAGPGRLVGPEGRGRQAGQGARESASGG